MNEPNRLNLLEGTFQPTSYTDQVKEVLKHLIFNGTYCPGDRLKEAELSRTLGISRSPIREAIHSLANEGLLRLIPQRGAFVASFSADEIHELFEVREPLEITASRLAAERATLEQLDKLEGLLEDTEEVIKGKEHSWYPRDLDFHQGIATLTQNKRLISSIEEINTQLQLARLRSSATPGRTKQAYSEHQEIFAALQARNQDKVEKAMRLHIRNSLQSAIEVLADDSSGVA